MAGGRSVVIAIENISFDRDTRARLIARTLCSAGYDVSAVCPRAPGRPKRDVIDGVAVTTFPTLPFDRVGLIGHLFEYAWCCSALALILVWMRLVGRAEIAHVCVPPHLLFPAVRLLRRLGCSVVVDQHDLMPELFVARYGRRHRLLYRGVVGTERAALQAADVVLATNESGARAAAERAGVRPDRIRVVRTAAASLDGRAANDDVRAQPQTVGYVGNVERQDGLELLVRAVPYVLGAVSSDVRFLCIGDGRDLPRIRRLATALGVASAIDFTGRVPHAEALARLAAAQVCVQPDPSNSFNDSCTMLKSLEYLALGKPVVAFDLPETRASCGPAALYAHHNDPADLGQKIALVLSDRELRTRLGRNARQRASGPLSWAQSERVLLDAYAQAQEASGARLRRKRRERSPRATSRG